MDVKTKTPRESVAVANKERRTDGWDIVNDYFCSVCDMPEEELDADSLSLVRVWHSFGLIQNGGFHCYLCAVGERASAVPDAYRAGRD